MRCLLDCVVVVLSWLVVVELFGLFGVGKLMLVVVLVAVLFGLVWVGIEIVFDVLVLFWFVRKVGVTLVSLVCFFGLLVGLFVDFVWI